MTERERIVRECYQAYAEGDRSIIEPLLADDFSFWSPADPGIDRATYFERCWPNAGMIGSFEIEHVADDGEAVFTNYTATRNDGSRFRNTEVHFLDGGLVRRTEVYFGWDLD